MKPTLITFIFLLLINVSNALTFEGSVKRTRGDKITIEVISENGESFIYNCKEVSKLFGVVKESTFKFKIEKNSYYTLVFRNKSSKLTKRVYLDTRNLNTRNYFKIVLSEPDTLLTFESNNGASRAVYVDESNISWIEKVYPK